MKTFFLIIFLVIPMAINAQTGIKTMTAVDKTQIELAHVKEKLQLSDGQAAKYKTIISKYYRQETEMLKNNADSSDIRVEKRFQAISHRNAEIKSILTPEQYEKYSLWMGLNCLNDLKRNKLLLDSPRK